MTRALHLRDTLWLTASLALVAAPHAARVPWWVTLLAATLLAWRLYIARAKLRLPHRALLMLVVVGITAGVYLNYGTLLGRDAGVALLVVMLTLKILEMRTSRDALLLIFLSYFLVITNFLYSQTIPTGLYMLGCVWVITATMIGIQYAHPPRSSAHQMRTAGVLLAQSAPLMLVFFVLFPRVQGPLWGMPADTQRVSTGLSDTMAPGSFSELTLSDAVAFRAAFEQPIPELKRLYWRGPVLWDYDGRTWRAPPFRFGQTEYETDIKLVAPVDYTVTVEPHGKPWLFALDLPAKIPAGARYTIDFQLVSMQPVNARRRYDMRSFLNYSYGRSEDNAQRQRALRLPAGYNPRAIALAKELRAKHGSDRQIVDAVLTLFNQDRFIYTLAPPILGQHAVDDFLFETKRGFCEHYSSAFAFLMRAAGIPARIVTGYLGGEPNPLGDYLIVRQADAHAWTEVWLPDEGWARIDPTSAVAPARIERGFGALATGSTVPFFGRTDLPLLRDLRLAWDSLANSWNQWVLGYTPERQKALLTRVGIDDATWRTLAVLLLAATGAVTLVLALITLRRLRVRLRDPVRIAYQAFCAKLDRRGLARDHAEGPLVYAERVVRARPDLESFVRRFTGLYVALRYGGGAEGTDVGQLTRMAREFKP